ncbi:MAG: NADH-quinone oxidoreductase subunit NuoN [Bdellovibrionales bacterium]
MNPEYIYSAFPEIFLSGAGMLLLMIGAVKGDRIAHYINYAALVALLIAGIFVLHLQNIEMPGVDALHIKATCYGCDTFNHMFIRDAFAHFVKVILIIAAALSLMLSWSYLEQENLEKPEYPVLILFATVGMMLMVSASDLLSLYVGLELQSLALYVLAAFRRDDAKSSEAGLKYFVLGALSSGLILYGISFIYGYAGTTQFGKLAEVLAGAAPPLGVVFGLVFIAAAMAFKISAVPFHMWTPDVYEGAPTPVTAFFASAPKFAALALLTRVLLTPFGGLSHEWMQIVVFVAVASMLLGAFAGLVQTNIKRLFAYSSIANVGFALVGLAAGGAQGVQALLIYFGIYFLNTLGIFGVILCLRRQGHPAEQIKDLAGISKTHPMLAMAMVIFMFSIAGVPPLAGFFGKYFVFLAAVKAGLVPLAVIGVLTSVVAAAYYLRIVKIMYFDDSAEPLDPVPERGLQAVLAISALAMLLFVLYPSPLIDSALVAARSLTGS